MCGPRSRAALRLLRPEFIQTNTGMRACAGLWGEEGGGALPDLSPKIDCSQDLLSWISPPFLYLRPVRRDDSAPACNITAAGQAALKF